MPFFRQFIVYLMIAVFFNTAIGVPLHAAEHLKGARQTVAVAAAAGPFVQDASQARPGDAADIRSDIEPDTWPESRPELQPEPRPDAHGAAESCAVCAAHAQQATAFIIWPMAPPVLPVSLPERPSYVPPATAATGQWPFAARDPPRA